MKKGKYVIMVIVAVIFVALSAINFFSSAKEEAAVLRETYYRYYYECKELYDDSVEIDYGDGMRRSRELMDSWEEAMEEQEAIVRAYDIRAVVFLVLSVVSVVGIITVAKIDKKRELNTENNI